MSRNKINEIRKAHSHLVDELGGHDKVAELLANNMSNMSGTAWLNLEEIMFLEELYGENVVTDIFDEDVEVKF